jgi:2-polyprenyl-6-methoxyphenol hydroxylase-like FAD-dependent oxidoreductase
LPRCLKEWRLLEPDMPLAIKKPARLSGASPLIVGAGPVGLAAALFLARRGQPVRLIEAAPEVASQSRALAVNPRTLELLESTGVSRAMLELGRPISGVRFYQSRTPLASLSFAGIHPKYPFMLLLSQATSSALLAQALEAAGGRIERGMKLNGVSPGGNGVAATLEHSGERTDVRVPWLLAADGARSAARHAVAVPFRGSGFHAPWHLADVPLQTPLSPEQAHVFFMDGGAFLFLIRVVDPSPAYQTSAPVWRVMGNRPSPLRWLPVGERAGAPLWESSFHVAHRVVPRFAVNGVYFAGDAAHVHSPVGARGMNLGIEDAWVFAQLACTDKLERYDVLRRPVDRSVVRAVALLSRVAAAEPAPMGLVRRFVFPLATRLPFIRRRMVASVTGLDHPRPAPLRPPERLQRARAAAQTG